MLYLRKAITTVKLLELVTVPVELTMKQVFHSLNIKITWLYYKQSNDKYAIR
jgi:hypothetical protein